MLATDAGRPRGRAPPGRTRTAGSSPSPAAPAARTPTRLRGLALRAEPVDDPDELWVHDLIGAEVVTVDGDVAWAAASAVVANPASDLLELDAGALVPVAFVVDHAPGRVTIDPPEGLFDL